MSMPTVRSFSDLRRGDVAVVGGKNSSLGELTTSLSGSVRVPGGFATTAAAYRAFLATGGLGERIHDLLADHTAGTRTLDETSRAIRAAFTETPLPEDLRTDVRNAYRELSRTSAESPPRVAVRSSATAEDLPEASFAGQQESFLGVAGEEELLERVRDCMSSLYTPRAIVYREEKGFAHSAVALSVGVQLMVDADDGAAGVMFTLDTESGFPDVVVINGSWGLGEAIVQGAVNPDQFTVYKPFLGDPALTPILGKELGQKEFRLVSGDAAGTLERIDNDEARRHGFCLTDTEILELGRAACAIEEHYGCPMDIEWARDAGGTLYILQARPETVHSRGRGDMLRSYRLQTEADPIATGLAIGGGITTGTTVCLEDPTHPEDFPEGGVLVTGATDPDWVPIMRRAGAIVTDRGGRTSHAAIISRELGIPAVIGTGNATSVLGADQQVTVSCAEGDQGHVYAGALPFEVRDLDLDAVPETSTRVMINIASPPAAMRWWRLPCKGVGLLRMEYIVGNTIKAHPLALVGFEDLEDLEARAEIERLARGHADPRAYFVDRLAWGIGTIAASRHPEPVIVRMSDFKTNEYAHLIGGAPFEPDEENPMLGWRGASRYSSEYRPGFALECAAIRKVRLEMGLRNVKVMIPFCRTPEEADRVLAVMAEEGLARGEDGLEVWVMCEIPANVILAEEFAERFDGFSIGSNDLTQLTLGVDRDSRALSHLFDEHNPAVTRLIQDVVRRAHACGRKVGFCGQAPSDHPDYAAFLVETGIDSISVTPDSILDVLKHVHEAEETRERADSV